MLFSKSFPGQHFILAPSTAASALTSWELASGGLILEQSTPAGEELFSCSPPFPAVMEECWQPYKESITVSLLPREHETEQMPQSQQQNSHAHVLMKLICITLSCGFLMTAGFNFSYHFNYTQDVLCCNCPKKRLCTAKANNLSLSSRMHN